MKTVKNTSSLTNFTLVNDTIQLKMNFNTEIYVKDDVKLRLVKNIIERMDLINLKKVYSSLGRKPKVNPITMLQIIIFCYSEGIFSSRNIEKSCKYDLRIKYLLDGENPPDHSTINRFRQKIVELAPSQVLAVVRIAFNQISTECTENKINFVYGQGKRKHQLQRDYEKSKIGRTN